MSIAEQVRCLEDENRELMAENRELRDAIAELKAEVEKQCAENAKLMDDYVRAHDMLNRQRANFGEHLAMRNQQLVDAAAAQKDAEDKIVNKDGEILYLTNRLARFQLVRDMLNGAQHGESPFGQHRDDQQMSFFRELPARAN